jgi:hypothetical protein
MSHLFLIEGLLTTNKKKPSLKPILKTKSSDNRNTHNTQEPPYRDHENSCEENSTDDLVNEFYNVKIKNELNENIDFNLVKIRSESLNEFSSDFQSSACAGAELKPVEACSNNDKLKIDYVPVGKIITINVSMMW